MASVLEKIAADLRRCHEARETRPPLRDELPDQRLESAYAVQEINTRHWLDAGRRLVGRKIGLTSKAVQEQLGVDQPDYGMLFHDMACVDGEAIDTGRLLQPKIEGEVAFMIGDDLDAGPLTSADVINAIDWATAAFEIVDSRIADWKIGILDTIADNASSGLFVLGTELHPLDGLDLRLCGAVLERFGEPVSVGAGAACLGNPLNAVLWLARKMIEVGQPLRRGDLVLSGALGPMVAVRPGDAFELRINGLGSVRTSFTGGN